MEFKDIYEQGRNFRKEAISTYEAGRLHLVRAIPMLLATRGPIPHVKIVRSWQNLALPMNAQGFRFDAIGKEVGEAYQQLFEQWIENPHPYVKGAEFAMTYEEDNILPVDGLLKLLSAIQHCPDCGEVVEDVRAGICPAGHKSYDGVSGLYWTKSSPGAPMAFGHPSNGPSDFSPQSVEAAIEENRVIEVNGIAMGFSVYRRGVFENLSKPWFKTGQGQDKDGKITQDLYFCKKARAEAGARFGVHCGVKVGHYDSYSGVTY